METKTSEQAYEEYQKLRNLEEKLSKQNRGLNLLNLSKFAKPEGFYIEIKVVSEVNLRETSSKVIINTDFPFSDWRYRYGEIGVKEFLEQLKEWVEIPRYEFLIQHNRKRDNQVSSWDLPKFRKFNIKIEEIKFDIGEIAQQKINLMGFDFKKEVEKTLSKQREATEEEIKDFERFRFLLEEVDNLKRQLPRAESYYYSDKKDATFKITIDKKTYNNKLQKVEEELKRLCDKYSFMQMPRLDYQNLLKRLSLEDWKSENEVEAEDEWSNFDDDEKEDYDGDFDNFLKSCYEHFLEVNDFDE